MDAVASVGCELDSGSEAVPIICGGARCQVAEGTLAPRYISLSHSEIKRDKSMYKGMGQVAVMINCFYLHIPETLDIIL